MARPSGRNIRQAALDEATRAIQTGGVTGFSYADLAERIGVRAPSIHHHFPRKDALVAETVAAYRQRFRSRVEELDDASPTERLRGYSQLFLAPSEDGVLCLCGAAVAGWDELSDEARREITAFFDGEIQWVEAQLREGQRLGEVRSDADPADLALVLVSALEGALLVSRTRPEGPGGAAAASSILGLVASGDDTRR